jgi:fatty acid amide hydrolase 2
MTPNQEDMLVLGPLCRYAEDLKLVFSVLAGKNKSKLVEYQIGVINIYNNNKKFLVIENIKFKFTLKDVKFFYIDQVVAPFSSKIAQGVREAQNKTISLMERKTGIKCQKIESNYLQDAFLIWLTMASEGVEPNQVCKLMTDGNGYKSSWVEFLKALIGQSDHTKITEA